MERIFLVSISFNINKNILLILYNSFNFWSKRPPQGGNCSLVKQSASHVGKAAALAVHEVDVYKEILTLHLVGEV